jgi:hypothetical protein
MSWLRPPLGPYSRPMHRALWWSWGGAVVYERGTPVGSGMLVAAVDFPRVDVPRE